MKSNSFIGEAPTGPAVPHFAKFAAERAPQTSPTRYDGSPGDIPPDPTTLRSFLGSILARLAQAGEVLETVSNRIVCQPGSCGADAKNQATSEPDLMTLMACADGMAEMIRCRAEEIAHSIG